VKKLSVRKKDNRRAIN